MRRFSSTADFARPMTALGYALLCEIAKKPRGGYALRMLFETTPLDSFSSSPGSIYPALKRLAKQGLIVSNGSGRDGRFEITRPGRNVLAAWFGEPVAHADVAGRIDLCMLRFAFMEDLADPAAAVSFLRSLEMAAARRASELTAFLRSNGGRDLPTHGQLAVDHGVRAIKATEKWARDALKKLRTREEKNK